MSILDWFIPEKKVSNWQTVNTSTSENVLNMQPSESKDFDQVMGKNKEVKDYKILHYTSNSSLWRKDKDGNHQYDSSNIISPLSKDAIIKSIKRLSDGEVFSVDDNEKHIGKITKIAIGEGGVYLFSAEENWTKLNFAEKQTVLKGDIILTTNEGVKVFNPENIIYILHKDFSKDQSKAGEISKTQNNIYFWSEGSLNNYIIQNKPVPVTAIELAKAINFTSDQLNQLVDFFKAKNK